MNKGNITINIEKLIDNFQVISNGEPLNLSELKEQTAKAITSAIYSPNPTPEYIPVVAKQDDEGHWYIIPAELEEDFNDLLERSYNHQISAVEREQAEDDFIIKYSQYMTGGDLNNKHLFIEAPKTMPRTVDDLAMNPDLEKRALEKFAPITNPYITEEYKEQLIEQDPEFYKKYVLGEWKEGISPDFSAEYSKGHCDGYKEGYKNAMAAINGLKQPGALEMVEEFHKAFYCPVLKSPIIPDVPFGYVFVMDHIEKIKEQFKITDNSRAFLRIKLMFEEFTEVAEAISTHDLTKILDGLCDLLYVVYGTAHEFGLGPVLKEAFREVHRSNMSKLGADGKPVLREDGKVLKGPNFTPPDLAGIITRYQNNQQDIEKWREGVKNAEKEGYADKYKMPDLGFAKFEHQALKEAVNYGISASLGANMPEIQGMPEPKNEGVIYSDLKQPPPTTGTQIETDK